MHAGPTVVPGCGGRSFGEADPQQKSRSFKIRERGALRLPEMDREFTKGGFVKGGLAIMTQ